MDIVLSVLLGLIQLVLAGLGVYVSLKPQPENRHKALIVAFVVCGFLGIALGVGQQLLNRTENASNRKEDIRQQGILQDKVTALSSELLQSRGTEEYMKGQLNAIGAMIGKINKSEPNPGLAKLSATIESLSRRPIASNSDKSNSNLGFGNLKDRVSDLSKEILSFLRMRESVLDSLYQQQKPGSNRWDVYGPWIQSTIGGFKYQYESRVFAIRAECAGLHVMDTELDKELQGIAVVEQAEQTNRTNKNSYFPPKSTIEKIAERLAILATQL